MRGEGSCKGRKGKGSGGNIPNSCVCVRERDEHLGVNLCTQAPEENVMVVKTYVKQL